MRPTWAEISLDALRHNFRAIQQHVGVSTVCAVVKANAYGHGLIECARAFAEAGAQWLGVTSTEEGIRLRDAGVTARILLMTGFWRGDQDDIVRHRLTPAIWEWWQVGALERALVKAGAAPQSFPVHVKVDSGMGRLGVPDYYMGLFLNRVRAARQLCVEGLFSHLASADILDDAATERQIALFAEFEKLTRVRGFTPAYVHLANSAAITARPPTWRDMVRPGLLLYGYALPFGWRGEPQPPPPPLPVRRALTWKTRIMSIKDVGPGHIVGYKATFTTPRHTKLGLLPAGYADGLARSLSSRGHAIVRHQPAPIIGAISMDLAILDLTDIPGAAVGDEVILLGCDGDVSMDACDHARLENTIPYEVLCRIAERVRRVYV